MPNIIEEGMFALADATGLKIAKLTHPRSRVARDIRRIVWRVAHRDLDMSLRQLASVGVLGKTWAFSSIRDALSIECQHVTNADALEELASEILSPNRPRPVIEAEVSPEEKRPTFEEVERGYFESIVSRHTRITDAATEAGITRHAMSRRLRRMGLSLFDGEHDHKYGAHGSVVAYNRGCRCDACTTARKNYQAEWYKKKSKYAEADEANKGPEIIEPSNAYERAMVVTMRAYGVPMCRCHTNQAGAPQARWALFLAMEDAAMDEKEIAEVEFFGRSYNASTVLRGLNRATEESDDPIKGPLMRRARKAAAEALAAGDGQSTKSA